MARSLEEMKRKVLAYVGEHDGCTFAELVAAIPGAEGEYAQELAGRNVVFWIGLSRVAAAAIAELRRDRLLHFVPEPTLLSYIASGTLLRLPVARSAHNLRNGYAEPHWLPIILTVNDPLAGLVSPGMVSA